MNLQSALMLTLCVVSEISALDWLRRAEYSDAFAFAAFGLGDLALAVSFWNGGTLRGIL